MERLTGTSIYDYLLIAVVAALAAVMAVFFFRMRSGEAEYAAVFVEGEPKKDILLSKDALFELGPMLIEVRDGRIRVLSADCPRKICVNSGWISSPGQSIICIPNKSVVSIIGAEEDRQYDAVTY